MLWMGNGGINRVRVLPKVTENLWESRDTPLTDVIAVEVMDISTGIRERKLHGCGVHLNTF